MIRDGPPSAGQCRSAICLRIAAWVTEIAAPVIASPSRSLKLGSPVRSRSRSQDGVTP